MPHPLHPDDELLSSLAADEPEAMTDAGLAEHVAACDRCGPMVDDLRGLRAALAQLPDVTPSRPLQLVPPVPDLAAAPASGGLVGLLRRLTAPAMAAAAALILVGAIGTTISSFPMGSAGAALSGQDAAAASAGAGGGHPSEVRAPGASDNTFSGASLQPVPRTADSGKRLTGQTPETPVNPYPWLLGTGVGLLGAAFLARGYVRRREPDEDR
jgi:hypothetical protein